MSACSECRQNLYFGLPMANCSRWMRVKQWKIRRENKGLKILIFCRMFTSLIEHVSGSGQLQGCKCDMSSDHDTPLRIFLVDVLMHEWRQTPVKSFFVWCCTMSRVLITPRKNTDALHGSVRFNRCALERWWDFCTDFTTSRPFDEYTPQALKHLSANSIMWSQANLLSNKIKWKTMKQ